MTLKKGEVPQEKKEDKPKEGEEAKTDGILRIENYR